MSDVLQGPSDLCVCLPDTSLLPLGLCLAEMQGTIFRMCLKIHIFHCFPLVIYVMPFPFFTVYYIFICKCILQLPPEKSTFCLLGLQHILCLS